MKQIRNHIIITGDDSNRNSLTVLRSIRQRIRACLEPDNVRSYLFRGANKKTICGIVAGTLSDTGIVFDKVEKALWLIESYDAKRFAQIQRDIKCIFVFRHPTTRGQWHQELQMCELDDNFVLAEDISVAEIASVIVHEATHARLMRLGFGYEEPKRLRIEHICFDSQRAFVRRLPDSDELLEEIGSTKSYYGANYYSDTGRRDEALEGLRKLGVPKWLVWLVTKLSFFLRETNSKQDS